MDEQQEAILREVHASFAVQWGTTAPFAIEDVYFQKIGFADIPVAGVRITSPAEIAALVPVARQIVYHELESCGVSNEAVAFKPSVNTERRRRKFVDINTSSPTLGSGKMGKVYDFHFEIGEDFRNLFRWQGRQGSIPVRGVKGG